MVVLKRKPTTESRVEYDNVIELDDRKSYNASQKETAEAGLYTQREAFTAPKQREDVMPKINKEPKAAVVPKQVVSSKTKVLLAAYIIIAVILAAVVIGTGVAITEAGKRSTGLEQQIITVSSQIDAHSEALNNVNSEEWLGEMAKSYNMNLIENPVEVELVGTVEGSSYSITTNSFDKFRDWIAGIFA